MNRKLRTMLPAVIAVAGLAAAACGTGSTATTPGAQPRATTSQAQTVAPVAASQSPSDAARDGVNRDFAAIPFAARVGVKQAIVAPEGVWVISRPPAAARKYAAGCRFGPEGGKYPTDTLCTTDYGEVLLLDASRSHVLRAYPLPSVPPKFLRMTADAIWCGRQGDTKLSESTLPDSMVCRIDRHTLKAHIRVFAAGQESEVWNPCFYPPKNWTVKVARLQMKDMQVDARGVWAQARNGTWTRLDLHTLAAVARNVTR